MIQCVRTGAIPCTHQLLTMGDATTSLDKVVLLQVLLSDRV